MSTTEDQSDSNPPDLVTEDETPAAATAAPSPKMETSKTEDSGGETDDSPVIVEHEDAVQAEALQIFSIGTEEDQYAFTFHEEKLKSVLEKVPEHCKVSVVSVVGAFRTGKSFLLSFFLRFLSLVEENPTLVEEDSQWYNQFESIGNKGFEWKAGSERNTTGIWMWSQPFFMNNGKSAVLLVDTQGMFDHETTMTLTTCIFGLGCLMSSYMIYNVDKRIQEDNLQHLALFVEYANMAMSQKAIDKDKKPFQLVEFLVRDWQHFDDDEESAVKMAASMEKYLNEEVMAMRDANDLKETREQIQACFEKIQCFGLCHPGTKVTKQKYDGNVKVIEADFLKLLDLYCRRIFNPQLAPKIIHDQELGPQEFFNYTKSYAAMFADGATFPTANTMLDATASANNTNARDEAIKIYKDVMDRIAGPSCSSFVKAEILEEDHRHNVTEALEAFDRRANFGNSKAIQKSRQAVREAIDEQYASYRKLNEQRNPLHGMELYIIPISIAGVSYLAKFFIDMTCSHDICISTSQLVHEFLAAACCFLAILVLTNLQNLKELYDKFMAAYTALSQPPNKDKQD